MAMMNASYVYTFSVSVDVSAIDAACSMYKEDSCTTVLAYSN
jgi:hypothetical protein